MADYRRLTEKHIPDAEFCSGCSFDDDLNGCEIGGCDKYYMYFETYERLRKLEDMIESGELVNANDIKSENAFLHKKFVALNKMPCNIGDTVYVLFGSCYRCEDYEGDHCSCERRGKDKIFEMKVGSVRFDKDDYYLYEDSIGISSGLSCSGRNYGKTWFLSMEEAKNHLMKSYDDVTQHA